jgi:hypothetical protein
MLSMVGLGLTYVAAQEAEARSAAGEGDAPGDEGLPLATTPEAQLAQAEAIHVTGEGIRAQVQGMLDEARREGDALRITCLEDKLAQIGAHLASVADRSVALDAAITGADEEARAHQYTALRVLSQTLRWLARDAAQCVGQDAFDIPEAALDSEQPEDAEDPTVLPETPAPAVPFIPPPASGFS